MNDALLRLAFSIYHSPGVYALLLGSGVSRSAGIPTGWEIVLGLIRRLAEAQGQQITGTPDDWYRSEYNEEPEYDSLLERLASTPIERNRLLRSYFEPSEEEQEEGLKQPTIAHQSIAWLVKNGYIRVVLTTNFDRLLEMALEEIGIVPDVYSTDESFEKMPPIQHSEAVIIKVHGDYRDWRIKNTQEELSEYGEAIRAITERISVEYGLVVCGWSAEYDIALRAALNQSRDESFPRFGIYWTAYRGALSEHASEIIAIRKAEQIDIIGADDFFHRLKDIVESLETTSRRRDLSLTVLVERTKKYLRSPDFDIELEELLRDEVVSACNIFTSSEFMETLTSRRDEREKWRLYFDTMKSVLYVAATIAWYGSERHIQLIADSIEQLIEPTQKLPLIYQYIPTGLFFYVVGILALKRDKWFFLQAMWENAKAYDALERRIEPVLQILSERLALDYKGILPDTHSSLIEYLLASELRNVLGSYLTTDNQFQQAQDLFEMLQSLVYQEYRAARGPWAPSHMVLFGRSKIFLREYWSSIPQDWALRNLSTLSEPAIVQSKLAKYMEIINDYNRRHLLADIPDYAKAFEQSPLWNSSIEQE